MNKYFSTFNTNFNPHIYAFSQLTDFFKDEYLRNLEQVQLNKKVQVYNIPCSFDIETSSLKLTNSNNETEKFATMYIWQFGINGCVIYGRTYKELITFTEKLIQKLSISLANRLYIYVHNLGYEFQFIRKWFRWNTVFATKRRRPIRALTYSGLEFRCSLFLSNYSLEYLGENLLHKYPLKKLVGSLDYSKVRHSETPLTEKELSYCINDVLVLLSYIQEKIEYDGSIVDIPLTNTGYVRKYCRLECFFDNNITELDRKRALLNYRALMKSLVIKDENEYKQLKRAFMGGFTHASCLYSNSKEPLKNIGSADLVSSYPYVMVAEYYPMSKAELIGDIDNIELLQYYLNNYCCLFDIEIHNLKPKVQFENILSYSRCQTYGKVVLNNGRIVSCEKLQTTLTELDYFNLIKFYEFDKYKILNFRIYKRGYLPKPLITSILNLYKDKTELKGIYGKEIEYLVSKNMINAVFGMMVTAIIRSEFLYQSEEWEKVEADVISQLNSYNKNFNRFLYYAWGVWVTAHARNNLFSAIYEFGDDYIYSDTDSIKGFNFQSHQQYFEKYNTNVYTKLLNMCNHYNIQFSMCAPKTREGKQKVIGVWEFEETYKLFKTVGAKRYIYQHENNFVNMTTAGVNKKYAMPYLIAKWNNIDFNSEEFENIKKAYSGKAEDKKYVSQLTSKNYDYTMIFEVYGEGLYIPPDYTGKMTLTYIDEPKEVIITDYLGNEYKTYEKSCIHMENQHYFMSLVGDYIDFLKGIQYEEY